MTQRIVLFSVLMLLWAGTGTAAQTAGKRPRLLTYSLEQSQIRMTPGLSGNLSITMDIADGWWSYGTKRTVTKDGLGPQPTEITLLASDVVSRTGDIQAPKPKTKYDENFALNIDYYERTATFLVPFRVGKNVRPGSYKAAVEIYAMVCDSNRCMPPVADTVYFTVIVEPATGPTRRQQQERDTKGDNDRHGELDPTDIRAPGWIPGRAGVNTPGRMERFALFDNRKRLI